MFVDNGGGGGEAVGRALRSIGESMHGFASAAASGAFEVSETGGQPLIDTITAFQKWATSQSSKLQSIAQEPMLGGSTGANAMKPFAQQVATDPQGFVPQFQALLQSLEAAKEAIRKAMDNYRATDDAKGTALRQVGRTLSA